VYSQGVRDLEAVVGHLRDSPELGVSRVIVVSFSAAAIEVRKAVARDQGRRIDGWVCVVGSPDLQSMARSISGGVDYVGGFERGHRFGVQELLGVRVDIDRIAIDAADHGMSFIEDSRCDLSVTRTPITWFHGRYDAWVDLARVRDVLSHGDPAGRRLIVLPTGHQLRTSRQAADAFRCIAREVGRMAVGRDLAPVSPPARLVRHLRVAESRRIPKADTDLQAFWRDYLMGRDRSVGIELLTAGSAYRAMMAEQLEALDVSAGQRIVDLGAGTGAFAVALARGPEAPEDVSVVALDYVKDALERGRRRLEEAPGAGRVSLVPVESDLDVVHSGQRIPVADAAFDGAIASLLLSYLERPELALAEMHRILRPGGRLVVSSLCRDADISRLYVEAFEELRTGAAGQDLPELREADLGTVARNFLNDAARILELEGAGAFHFMDPDELAEAVRCAGFEDVSTHRSLGTPPQAVVLSARRPHP
jgi:ubiquinone/menaquinone biosynthesis C-methylase UbiE